MTAIGSPISAAAAATAAAFRRQPDNVSRALLPRDNEDPFGEGSTRRVFDGIERSDAGDKVKAFDVPRLLAKTAPMD